MMQKKELPKMDNFSFEDIDEFGDFGLVVGSRILNVSRAVLIQSFPLFDLVCRDKRHDDFWISDVLFPK
jgi:hypothetical protein